MGGSNRTGGDARRLPASTPYASGLSDHHTTAASMLELQQRERSRVAFDLHDGPAQSIATALLQARLLKTADPAEFEEGLNDLEIHLLDALDQLYAAMERLRSKALDHQRLVEKLTTLCAEFSTRSGVDVRFNCEGTEGELSDSLQIALFQIVHEALQNVGRHAFASVVRVDLLLGDETVQAVVVDDGKGFEPASCRCDDDRRGYGLLGMRERARLLGGECDISSHPGGGCRVEAKIPVWRG